MWSTTENGLKSWFHMCALSGRFAGPKPLSIPSLLKVTQHKLCRVLHPDMYWRPGDSDYDSRERNRCMATAITAKINQAYDEWHEAYAASEWGRKDGNNQLRCFPRDYINNFGKGNLDVSMHSDAEEVTAQPVNLKTPAPQEVWVLEGDAYKKYFVEYRPDASGQLVPDRFNPDEEQSPVPSLHGDDQAACTSRDAATEPAKEDELMEDRDIRDRKPHNTSLSWQKRLIEASPDVLPEDMSLPKWARHP